MNVKLALDMRIVTYRKLLKGEENQLESGMQDVSTHTKITRDYSGGRSPGTGTSTKAWASRLAWALAGVGPGCFSHVSTSSSKMVVVKKIEFCDGKLVSESSGVLPK